MTNTNCLENIVCPQCGHTDSFIIEVKTHANVTDDGAVKVLAICNGTNGASFSAKTATLLAQSPNLHVSPRKIKKAAVPIAFYCSTRTPATTRKPTTPMLGRRIQPPPSPTRGPKPKPSIPVWRRELDPDQRFGTSRPGFFTDNFLRPGLTNLSFVEGAGLSRDRSKAAAGRPTFGPSVPSERPGPLLRRHAIFNLHDERPGAVRVMDPLRLFQHFPNVRLQPLIERQQFVTVDKQLVLKHVIP